MKEKRRSQARRAAFRRRSIIVTVLGLAAAGTIMVLGSLGLYPRACLIASSLLSLFTLFYAISTFRSIRADNARLQREITIAKLRLSANLPPPVRPARPKGAGGGDNEEV